MACHGGFGRPGFRGSFGRNLSLYFCLSFGFALIRMSIKRSEKVNVSGQVFGKVFPKQADCLSVDLADPRLAYPEAGRNFREAHVLVIVHG
jgi:hypothetical protein